METLSITSSKKENLCSGLTQKEDMIGLTHKKDANFEVVVNAEMIEHYDIFGCYILQPWTMAIWEAMQFDVQARTKGEMGAAKTLCSLFDQPQMEEGTLFSETHPMFLWYTMFYFWKASENMDLLGQKLLSYLTLTRWKLEPRGSLPDRACGNLFETERVLFKNFMEALWILVQEIS
ncbi:proline--tRNA ligase, cytoplasmic-like [Amaranthus tricolor]|uniref:proline--tRNA ligase, cytoplasmic-like n=1 Tax=Amaranthus tricolor TaxID=29722 RepID=UPI00258C7D56|nr:proline--tRNA ligase, cytoplasmic-like [Amaranthus tricolor]